MEPVVVVALVGMGLAVLAIAIFLIAMARALVRVTSQLHVVLSAAVATLSETVPATDGALDELNADLAAVQDLLERLPGKAEHGE